MLVKQTYKIACNLLWESTNIIDEFNVKLVKRSHRPSILSEQEHVTVSHITTKKLKNIWLAMHLNRARTTTGAVPQGLRGEEPHRGSHFLILREKVHLRYNEIRCQFPIL